MNRGCVCVCVEEVNRGSEMLYNTREETSLESLISEKIYWLYIGTVLHGIPCGSCVDGFCGVNGLLAIIDYRMGNWF